MHVYFEVINGLWIIFLTLVYTDMVSTLFNETRDEHFFLILKYMVVAPSTISLDLLIICFLVSSYFFVLSFDV